MIERFAFISRHEPTQKQIEIAARHNVVLEAVGDIDPFYFDFDVKVGEKKITKNLVQDYSGVIVDNAYMALKLASWGQTVGVFEGNWSLKIMRVSWISKEGLGSLRLIETKQPKHDGLPNPDDPVYEQEIHGN